MNFQNFVNFINLPKSTEIEGVFHPAFQRKNPTIRRPVVLEKGQKQPPEVFF